MEQLYLIEIFIDRVTIYASEGDLNSAADKRLIMKVRFGPKIQFIIKEGQLAKNEAKDDVVETDEYGRRKYTRTIRVGKSLLFSSYSDSVLMTLSQFPLEIEVWNDDENEVEIFVGIGTMLWETDFYHMLKETADPCFLHTPLSVKQFVRMKAECCCRNVGEIGFILRISPLGDGIITEYQQLLNDPERFVFRTNKAPSMFECKRVDGEDPNFCMVGSLYETATLEDPSLLKKAEDKIMVCMERDNCGYKGSKGNVCEGHIKKPDKTYPIEKIRMGDITGPCGNSTCPLAHKIRTYIRNLDAYKQKAANLPREKEGNETKKICGTCGCKDDRWHRDECPAAIRGKAEGIPECKDCRGTDTPGNSCKERRDKHFGTGNTPKGSPSTTTQQSVKKTTVNYLLHDTQMPSSSYRRDYVVENVQPKYDFQNAQKTTQVLRPTGGGGCSCCSTSRQPIRPMTTDTMYEALMEIKTKRKRSHSLDSRPPSDSKKAISFLDNYTKAVPTNNITNPLVYNVETQESCKQQMGSQNQVQVYNACTDPAEDNNCKCNPQKPSPPCRTLDCECMTETQNILARKKHKPFCPLYKHKNNCPVTRMNEEEEKKEEEEDEAEVLPYGLPPVQLGPCPVLCRPCSVPDGFARMYKNALLQPLPPSYSDAGKVCCSKEFERIKKAIKEYMKYEKDHDFRCINKYNVDTERRCCDKEQTLLALLGKGCCGAHKLSIQDKYKEEK